jgi:hypothetical protein
LIILCAFKMKASRSKSPRKSIISEKMLDDFILRFGEKIPKSKPAKVNRAKKIISQYTIPERYLEGLSGNEKLLRQIELVSKKRQTRKERYKPLKSDVIARQKGIPKKGSCTARWEKMYPNARTNAQKAKITGIPKDILDKVDNKGRGAYYSSGSRPGQTAISWGIARVNCFALNKKTVTDGPDRNLYQDAIRRSPKAKQWFSKTKF